MLKIVTKYFNLHPFDVAIDEAKRIQKNLAKRIVLKKIEQEVVSVAGVDVAFRDEYGCCAIVVLNFPELKVVEEVKLKTKVGFPYIPGFLSFREGPCILEAIKGLKSEPNLFLFDGQGIAHPRKMGLATHIGILLDKPSIGCAKSHLFGDFGKIDKKKGSFCFIKKNKEAIGIVLRTRDNVAPVFASPGYKITLEETKEFILKLSLKFRIPEPLRLAHSLSIK
ncbi:MAG: endonuclease V [bacterium]